MRAQLIGSGDRPPVEGAARLENILFIFRRELIEFGRYCFKLAVDSIYSGDANKRMSGMWEPGNRGKVRLNLFRGPTVHSLEQWGTPITSRVKVNGRR